MPPAWFRFALVLACALATACGGGGGGTTSTPLPVAPPAARGDLIGPPAKLASFSTSTLLADLSANSSGKELLKLAFAPKCAIDVYQLRYRTVDVNGTITPVSAALMVPSGTLPQCSGSRPILLYAHGTTADRNFNIANIEAPGSGEGLLLGAVFAADGYIVVAPNFAGYDTSTLAFHPYLNADQQSKDMIDALHAARTALPTLDAPRTTDNSKLFITGYSQGGYVAMATHRALQAAGVTVTASAPMSGPYALAAFADAIFAGQVSRSAPLGVTLLINSYQKAYGNIYGSTAEVFEGKYAATIDSLLPNVTPLSDLEKQGKIPRDIVFSSTPPDAAFAALTPATKPSRLAAVFANGFGADNLVTNAFRLAYLQDATAAPDGGFPSVTDGVPAANPSNRLRLAFKTNDLRNWTPSAPVLLCAGNGDPTVFYFNTALMQQYWTTHVPTVAPVVLDIDASPGNNDPNAALKTAFLAAKDAVRLSAVLGGARDGGDQAVASAYHAALVPPFCLAATKAFFDAH